MPKLRTHYDNLKVTRDAPAPVIWAAHQVLVAEYALDAEILRIINRSYGVLSDPVKRAEHDRWIAEAEAEPVVTPPVFQHRVGKWTLRNVYWAGAVLILCLLVAAVLIFSGKPSVPGEGAASSPEAAPPATQAVEAVPATPAPVLQPAPIPKKAHQRPVRSEIDEVIQSGKYSPMPHAEVVSPSTGYGPSHLSVENKTAYTVMVTFFGSTERSGTILAGQSLELDIAPGAYRVLGRTDNPTVLPFVGNDKYEAGGVYGSTYYVKSRIVP